MKKLLAKILIVCLLVTTMGTLEIPTVANAAVQYFYYVSPTGSDSNPGTLSQPFLTISKARDIVRTVNDNMTGDIVVYLRGGTYTLDSALQMNSQDSGTNGFNIIYTKYQNEIPVISGGVNVTGWSLFDSTKNIYRAYAGTSFYSRELFVNGVRATRAKGEANPSGFVLDATKGFNLPTSGPYANMENWGNKSDIEIHQKVQWTIQWGKVNNIISGKIIMAQPFWGLTRGGAPWGIGMSYPEVIENAYELLDAEGEWYLNRTDGYLEQI